MVSRSARDRAVRLIGAHAPNRQLLNNSYGVISLLWAQNPTSTLIAEGIKITESMMLGSLFILTRFLQLGQCTYQVLSKPIVKKRSQK